MSTPNLSTPDQALAGALRSLHKMPVFIAGSCVAAQAHAMPGSWSDLDVFVPTEQVLIATVQHLLDEGYVIHERFDRVWARWLKYGLRGWKTNSMRMQSVAGVETNVVYKITDNHATTSLAQVLESFDFGLLGMGYDVETNMYRDMRPYLFPGMDIDGPLPLMPDKRQVWRSGFISQYNGMREANRYVKYSDYGYDMSAVKEDLVLGYMQVALYHSTSFDEDKKLLGQIYAQLGTLIDDGGLDELREFYETMDYKDPLEQLLEALV